MRKDSRGDDSGGNSLSAKERGTGLIGFWVVLCASLVRVGAVQELVFEPTRLDGLGRVLLALRGEPNTNYVIETSGDLRTWKPIFVGTSSAAGKLEHVLRPGTNSSAYYTARGRTDLEKLIVIPRPDTNYGTVALVTTNGGTCSLTNKEGVIYTFTAPPFAVVESVVISMVLLTNIDHFPLTNGFGAAVSFEPDGLEFLNPAFLEIRYPTNIAMLEVVSYASVGMARIFISRRILYHRMLLRYR